MAGSKTSATVTLPLPKFSIASIQAAAAPAQLVLKSNETPSADYDEPGTVTELRSVVGMRPLIPRDKR